MVLALEYMHGEGYFHRDLKPDNVMLRDNFYATIIDFGLAISTSEGAITERCGTPQYMAPEIYQEKPYDQAVDMWAVGIMVYELMTLNLPYDENQLIMLGLSNKPTHVKKP